MRLGLGMLAWACVSALLLVAGTYAFGLGLVSLRLDTGGAGAPEGMQRAALGALVETLAREALLPHAAFTLLGWCVLVRLEPRVDGSWRALGASLAGCALLAFPLVGGLGFEAWSPRGAGDVVATAALLSGAVGAALWLGRRLVPGLGPGRFGATPR
jgi:hypothetical protein